ncbi:MAG: Tellurite resistance protein TerB [Hyphomicrobiales bacterium]|nr:MAG: Tellurite resistance protein TerB [Hyphomicrobiales bacterium]
MSKKISHHDALIYVMVTIAAADRAMTDSELLRIGEIIQTLPIFRDYNREKLIGAAEDCSQMLQDEDGLEIVLDKVAETLPQKLYETAYALAVEVAAADLHVEQEELRFLQLLRDRLDLDKLTIAAIEAGARARHRIL